MFLISVKHFCMFYLPQKDWKLHSHTEWKWSLIGHCTIWGHQGSRLHLSHWHQALRGQVQGGLDRGAGLHQPRQHTEEKWNNKDGQTRCDIIHMQIKQPIISLGNKSADLESRLDRNVFLTCNKTFILSYYMQNPSSQRKCFFCCCFFGGVGSLSRDKSYQLQLIFDSSYYYLIDY